MNYHFNSLRAEYKNLVKISLWGCTEAQGRRKGIDKGEDDQDKIQCPQIPPAFIMPNKVHGLWKNGTWV